MSGEKVYIQKLVSNVKGQFELELAPCTLISGPNRSGKSRVVDSASLLLCNQAYTRGLGKAPAVLRGLTTDEDGLKIKATLSNGSTIDWTSEKWIIDGIENKKEIGIFILEHADRILYGDKEKLKQVILAVTQAVIERRKIYKELEDAERKEFEKLWPTEEATLDFEVALKVLKEIETKRKSLNAEIKKSVAADSTTSIVSLSAAEEAELTNLLWLVEKFGPDVKKPEIQSELAKLTEKIQECEDELGPKQLDLLAKLEQAQRVLDIQSRILDVSPHECPVCQSSLDLEKINEYYQRIRSALDARQDFIQQSHTLQDKIAELEKQREQFHHWEQTIEYIDVPARIAELQTRKSQSGQTIGLKLSAAASEEERELYNNINKAFRGVITDTTQGAAGLVERRLNRFLPRNMRVRIVTSGEDNDTFELHVGFVDKVLKEVKTYYPFCVLSGGERISVVAALACSSISDDAPAVRVLVIDDVWLDARTLKALMKATATIVASPESGPSQAIFCAVDWKAKMVDGWELIRMPLKEEPEATIDESIREVTELEDF